MTRRQRLRNTAQLCLHCLRNMAYYRVTHEAGKQHGYEQYWITASNNFLDVGVLDWCKIFADIRGKHNWRKSVGEQDQFQTLLLEQLRLTEDFWQDHVQQMKTYRDKFVAHLDDELRMQIPNMSPTIKSCQFLYSWLIEQEDDCNAFPDAPNDPVTYFRQSLSHAREHSATAAYPSLKRSANGRPP